MQITGTAQDCSNAVHYIGSGLLNASAIFSRGDRDQYGSG